jgi:dienelactone hydrolase
MSLPRPSGAFAVGTVTHELVDAHRPVHLLHDEPGRRLLLKLWYPTDAASPGGGELVWSELRNDARTPRLIRGLLALLRQRSASCPGARMVSESPPRVVIYNHGFVSFAAENTSLMQELASHGYTVIAIQHQAQLQELQALNRAQPAAEKQAAAVLARQLIQADRNTKSRLARQYYSLATVTNRIVRERALDTGFLLDHLPGVLATIPGSAAVAPSAATPLHLVGYSVGGAVATEVALHCARVAAVVNLDGGTYGSIDATGLRMPCLMLSSGANDGINDALLPTHALRIATAHTTHLNFHDVASLLPGLRLLRAIGKADAGEFLRWRNQMVRQFCDSPANPGLLHRSKEV